MQKLTLSFLNNKCPIPIVRFPLMDGKSIYAVIDTGSDSTVYDKSLNEDYPELLIKTKHYGARKIIGVQETIEMDIQVSGLCLSIPQRNAKNILIKLIAYEHMCFNEVTKPMVEQEGMTDKIPLLIGSDTLIRYNANIDMKNKVVCFSIPEPKNKAQKMNAA